MTCKDCLHCDWCKKVVLAFHFGFDENAENMENNCGGFENRSDMFDKQTPKKPIGDLHSVPHFRCPVCKNGVKTYEDSRVYPYCHHCGQALDWSDYE